MLVSCTSTNMARNSTLLILLKSLSPKKLLLTIPVFSNQTVNAGSSWITEGAGIKVEFPFSNNPVGEASRTVKIDN